MPEVPFKLAIKPNPKISLRIVHEDADLLVLDKPAGTVVQPGKGHTTDAILNGLFALHGKLFHNLGERRDFGLLHRLDKDTSGLVLVAKMPSAYDQLRRDFEARNVDKEYLALTAGIPASPQGVVQARLKEIITPAPDIDPHDRRDSERTIKKVVISRQGQEAISTYQVVSQNTNPATPAALVRVTIKTGRLHQIRAHMMFLNTPVLGDDMYQPVSTSGKPLLDLRKYGRPPRLCLHAAHLGFKHPTTGKWLHFELPLPGDIAAYAKRLGFPELPAPPTIA